MHFQRRGGRPLLLTAMAVASLGAQTTQGIITGRVSDSRTDAALGGVRMLYRNTQTGESGTALSCAGGLYSMPSLAPGTYILRAEHPDYQPREWQTLELSVAARLEIDFPLRPLRDALQSGDYNSALLSQGHEILPVIGPDLEAGRSAPVDATSVSSAVRQPSLSYVVDPRQIGEAPLSARNVYALMTTLPAVLAAPVSGRGLQISANGQRASSSNFLLDGVQNNDFLNTGAFTPTTPESVQEYRVSTNNYSAEYGHTGGFVANAITRRGGDAHHGEVYAYFDQQRFDANTFQNNAAGLPGNPFRQLYAGYAAGGPIRRDVLFFSSSFEQLRSRSRRNPTQVGIFLPDRLRQCLGAPTSPVLALYDRFPLRDPGNAIDLTSPGAPCGSFALYTYGPPVSLDRSLALERFDYRSSGGKHRLLGRVALSRTTQPDFYPSPYDGLSEPLRRNSSGAMIGYVTSFGANLVNDARFSRTSGEIGTLRPHPEIPLLKLLLNAETMAVLPSAGSGINFGARWANYEAADGLTWTRGAHIVTAGGGLLLRRPRYLMSYLGDGLYNFSGGALPQSVERLAAGRPASVELPIGRQAFERDGTLTMAPGRVYDRYSNNQYSAYAQDNIRLTRRLALNLGVRYESFGTLLNTGAPRGFLQPGAGSSIDQRLANAGPKLEFDQRPAYRPDRNDWAARFGVSFAPSSRTVLRAGFGVFHDRLYDNALLDARNRLMPLWPIPGPLPAFPGLRYTGEVDFGQSIAQLPLSARELVVPAGWRPPDIVRQAALSLERRIARSELPELLWLDENLRTPYVQSWFASTERQATRKLSIELNASGALGRKLLANDLVNRLCFLECPTNAGRLNGSYGDILHRSNAGSSSFAALGAVARYRGSRTFFQIAYTYSHSIDNQSDAMLSDVFNLAHTNLDSLGAPRSQGIFTRQFDSRADRGSSDFDIRHNLFYYGIVELPHWRGHAAAAALTRDWTFSQVLGVRSGLPYTYFAPASSLPGVPPPRAILIGVRGDLTGVSAACSSGCERPGGRQLLDLSAIRAPAPGSIGNLGRNSLPGPGFWNADLSLSRSFALRWLGEAGRLRAGVSAFNVFNHSNLGLPDSSGFARYGPSENQTQFPAALPAFPSPRRLQFQLRIIF